MLQTEYTSVVLSAGGQSNSIGMCNPLSCNSSCVASFKTHLRAMKVIIALLFVLSIAHAFVPAKFSAALVKAIQGKMSDIRFDREKAS